MATATREKSKTTERVILNPEDPASAKQLIFIQSLVRETGAKVHFPANRKQASETIDKLKKKLA